MIETKFDLESNVSIKVCGVTGIVVGINKTPDGISYKVAYQDHEGDPDWNYFSEVELESSKSDTVGFGRKE